MEKLLPKFEDSLSEFVGDLRSLVFSKQSKAAEYFHVRQPTVSRYESGGINPPVGYLACLAKLLVERQAEPVDANYCKELLYQVNRAIRRIYYPDEVPFDSWEALCAEADEYLAQRQASEQPEVPTSDPLPQRPEVSVNSGPVPVDLLELSYHRNGAGPDVSRKEKRVDWFLISLGLGLGVSLLIGVDISGRFLRGTPDGLSFWVIAGLGLLFTLVAAIILMPAGEWLLVRITRLRNSERQAQAGLVFLLGAGFILFQQVGLSWFAAVYNDWGVEARQNNLPAEAKAYFERAISLDPGDYLAHYNLGSLYEDGANRELARQEYRLAAIEGGLDAAYNNLARLYILDKAYTEAVILLKPGLARAEDDEVKYDMLKNLGWAYLELENYPEARKYLKEALILKPNKGPAHCLIAELLERRQQSAEALPEWDACITYANGWDHDMEQWIKKGQERLLAQEEQP